MVHPLMVDIDLVKLVIFPYSVSLLQGILIFHIMLRCDVFRFFMVRLRVFLQESPVVEVCCISMSFQDL